MDEKDVMLSEKEIEAVKEKYPSICFECDNGRRVASRENEKNGHVGCRMRCYDNIEYPEYDIKEGKEVAEGWVDLRSRPFDKQSGIISNFQLITLEIKSCKNWRKR